MQAYIMQVHTNVGRAGRKKGIREGSGERRGRKKRDLLGF